MAILILIVFAVVTAMLIPAPIPVVAGQVLFAAGLIGSVASAVLSIHYWKTRDPFNYMLAIKPNPDGKVVPIWVSWLNLLSWAVIAMGVVLFIRHW